MTEKEFEGRTAVVTGGSRGIGFEVARELLQAGANVAITARKAESLGEAKALLGNDRLFTLQADVRDEAGAARLTEAVVAQFGSIDYLVNNVGASPFYGPLSQAPTSVVAKTFEINVVGTLAVIQACLRTGMADKGGAIVNVTSLAAGRTAPNLGVYAMSKAAMAHLTMQLSLELAPAIRVNAVAPAIIRTRFSAARTSGHEEELLHRYPLGRFGLPEDVASAVIFLLSDRASWITGETLVIDGGAAKVDVG